MVLFIESCPLNNESIFSYALMVPLKIAKEGNTFINQINYEVP